FRHCASLDRLKIFIAKGVDFLADNFARCLSQTAEKNRALASIKLMVWALHHIKPLHINPTRVDKPVGHAYSDAALEDVQGLNEKLKRGQFDNLHDHKMSIGAYINLPQGARFFRLKLNSLPRFLAGEYMHIGILEALAVNVSTFIWAHLLRDYFLIQHVDNLGDVFALCANSTRCPRTQKLSASIHQKIQ
ncbi:unnamed protein product, partial [Amoebophrya sp. A25]